MGDPTAGLMGTRLGVYHLEEHIGAGGMGEVYRARDTRLNRHVAIKVLSSGVTRDAGRLARVEREAQTLAALNHPNIATSVTEGRPLRGTWRTHPLDTLDGKRFLINCTARPPGQFVVLMNWAPL
jgi:serine/threonine protein kinase